MRKGFWDMVLTFEWVVIILAGVHRFFDGSTWT